MFGCDPTHQDHDGYTAAHYVAERDDVETLKALTTPIDSKVKVVSEEKKASLHERCLQALSIQNNQGLTVFMVAVRCESMKCLDYLLGLNINDANLQVYIIVYFFCYSTKFICFRTNLVIHV